MISRLPQKGIETVAVQNPLTSFDDDVAVVDRAIASAKGPVVLVGDLWAGAVITQADGAIAVSGKTTAEAATLDRYISGYLSSEHRDKPGQGCPLAALVCEMPRQSSGVREKFTAGLRAMIGQLTGRMDAGLKQRQRDEQALATLASLVGALVLARAVNDPKLSDNILRATKNRLDD